MNEEIIYKVNSLLLELESRESRNKDIIIDNLCDYIEHIGLPTEIKNNIVDNIIRKFDLTNNYDLQESIFNFLGTVSDHKVMQDRIIDFMLDYMSKPEPKFIEYALHTIMGSDLSGKEDFIDECLKSHSLSIKKEAFNVLKYYN
jgi:hypothetical protein